MSPASVGDGLIDIGDLSLFSVTFGEIPGGGGWNAEGDFGPTDDFSRFGIPEPDDKVDLDDVMIIAMNYGNVAPAGPSGQMILASSETPLRELVGFRLVPISRDGNRVTYAVMIENDAELLKGFSLDLSYGFGNELVEVKSSASLTGKGSEHFFGTIERDAGKVELCVASLGVNRPFDFTGEVARIVVREGSGVPALVQLEKADLRDVNNRRDEVTMTNGGGGISAVPTVSALLQNHPNPFNPTTTITFDVAASGQVRIEIYDVAGRLVRSLMNAQKDAGRYTVEWNGRDANGSQVHTGVYFYRMTAPGYTSPAKKMVMLK